MSQETVKHTPGPSGLTKREHFASLFLQGIIANEGINAMHQTEAIDKDCERAITYADRFIATLAAKAEKL